MRFSFIVFLLTVSLVTRAASDTLIHFTLPDSIKAVSIIADVKAVSAEHNLSAGIHLKWCTLAVVKGRSVQFGFPSQMPVLAKGVGVKTGKGSLSWRIKNLTDTSYKLLLTTAIDSAERFVLMSGYVYLPSQAKWKLMGTCKISDNTEAIVNPGVKYAVAKSTIENIWIQKSSGGWKQLATISNVTPVINPLPNIDSVQQYQLDKHIILAAISNGKIAAMKDTMGVFYAIVEPGNGKNFTVADSITVKYQLRIFGTNEVISGNETDTYTFPLKNLIKAWQIAVPLVKSGGGKIKLVIPSGLGYSIRTRAPKIPPNSILQFDVEVLDVKPLK